MMMAKTAVLVLVLTLATAGAVAASDLPGRGMPCRGEAAKHTCQPGLTCRARGWDYTVADGQGLCADGLVCCMRGHAPRCRLAGGACGRADQCADPSRALKKRCPGSDAVACCRPSAEGARFRRPAGHRPAPLDLSDLPLPQWWRRFLFRGDKSKLCFPVRAAHLDGRPYETSFAEPRGKRDGKYQRCHAGVDIHTKGDAEVRAMADGEVTNTFLFTTCDGPAHAVLVHHEELGITVNYGEVDADSVAVKKGDKVKRGHLLGKATACGMLHLEVYQGRRRATIRWPAPTPSSDRGLCRGHTPPSRIRNPWPTLNELLDEGSYC